MILLSLLYLSDFLREEDRMDSSLFLFYQDYHGRRREIEEIEKCKRIGD